MSEPVTILFSSAGRRAALMDCFRAAGRALNVNLRVLAADMNPAMSPACHLADRAFAVPPCADPGFVPELLRICLAERVALVVPTIDPELAPLSEARASFRTNGVEIAISSPEIVALARNKLELVRFLERLSLPTPRTAGIEDFLASGPRWNFPVLIKPIAGSASKDIHLAHSAEAARIYASNPPEYFAQERWRGTEYTVNLFFDPSGLRCAISHHRLETRAGEVSKAATERAPAVLKMAWRLGEALAGKAFGPLCVQAIQNEAGNAGVIDLNARFGGGYPLADRAGAEFAKWLLEIVLHRPSSVHDRWREGVTMLRYDSAVYFG